jgi:hypothetical protein
MVFNTYHLVNLYSLPADDTSKLLILSWELLPGSLTDRSTGWYDEDAKGSWKKQRYISPKDRKTSSARRSRLFARRRFAREMLRQEVKGILRAVPRDMESIGEDLGVTVAGLNSSRQLGKYLP